MERDYDVICQFKQIFVYWAISRQARNKQDDVIIWHLHNLLL